jgi:phage FluMu protein Com
MPIEFRCTQCNRLLRTKEEAAGKQAKCPECGAILDVPATSAPHEVTGAPPAETGAFAPAPAAGPESPFGPGPPPPSGMASPFGPDVPLSGGAPAPENRYESPRGAEAAGLGPVYQTGPDAYAYASSRVEGPAIALIVTGVIGLALQALGLVVSLVQLAVPGAAPDQEMMPFGPAFGPGVNVFFAILGLALSILVIVGAWKMKNLQSYGLAMTSAIVAVVPCISPCCCLGLPFGVWGLVVLSDSQVQAAFQTQASQGNL